MSGAQPPRAWQPGDPARPLRGARRSVRVGRPGTAAGGRVRRWAAVAVGAVLSVAAAGCAGRPGGVDGDLVNGWPAFAAAVTATPVAGVCYPGNYTATWIGAFNTVPCDNTHHTETGYVGTFTGADADRATPPRSDSPARTTAYRQCQQGVSDYLGGDWHTAPLWLGLVLPSDKAWTGGARWYRCDLVHFADPNLTQPALSGSVRDGLRGARPLAITCIDTTENSSGEVTDLRAANCAQPHNGELAGVYTAPDGPYPGNADDRKRLGDHGCERVVAGYLGFTGGTVQNASVGWMWTNFDEDQWALGDRSIQCYAYAYTASKKMVGSVKGLRAATPKS